MNYREFMVIIWQFVLIIQLKILEVTLKEFAVVGPLKVR